MDDVKQRVDNKIASKKVMVFSKSWCPHSKVAKDIFARYQADGRLGETEYEDWDIDHVDECDAIQDYLASITNARTVPRVFINGECIGGGSDTKKLDETGELLNKINPQN